MSFAGEKWDILAPINLLIALIRVFIIDSWKHIDDWKDQGLRK